METKVCCTDQKLCARHSPKDGTTAIYLGKGEDVRRNYNTNCREIVVPVHGATTKADG